MLRALAAAFNTAKPPAAAPVVAMSDVGVQQTDEPLPRVPAPTMALPQEAAPQYTAAMPNDSAHPSQLQGLLHDLTHAVHTWRQPEQVQEAQSCAPPPPSQMALKTAAAAEGQLGVGLEEASSAGALRAILRQQGIDAGEVQSLVGLLQMVLDSMEAIAQRAQHQHQPEPSRAVAPVQVPERQPSPDQRPLRELDGRLAAAAAALQPPCIERGLLWSGGGSSSSIAVPGQADAVEQLSRQFSSLLSATTSSLQEVQGELQLARQLEAVASAVAAVAAASRPPQQLGQPTETVSSLDMQQGRSSSALVAADAAEGREEWQEGRMGAAGAAQEMPAGPSSQAPATLPMVAQRCTEQGMHAAAEPALAPAIPVQGRTVAAQQLSEQPESSQPAARADCEVQTEAMAPYQVRAAWSLHGPHV
jgi:hypothetical protein